jgi:uncharacterized membrane protein YbhN (UPF0104 family)
MKKILPYLTLVFFILVGYLLYQTFSQIDWTQVQVALTKFSWVIILPALSLALLDYFILTSYDFMGFKYFHMDFMTYPKVLVSAFCCYAFNLNLGAMVGGMGFRFRIYSGWGVAKAKIAKIVLFSSFTNWLGHAFLISTVFCFQAESIQTLFALPTWISFTVGLIQYGMILFYFYACYKRKVMTFKETQWAFPELSQACLQIFLSSIQWTLISLIIYILIRYLGHDVPFGKVMFTSLVASIAGVLTHIPGGLGVLETIFLRVPLGIPAEDLLAALICYRLVYYLFPLIIAVPSYLGIEYYQKRESSK